jgi:hypothetical protein
MNFKKDCQKAKNSKIQKLFFQEKSNQSHFFLSIFKHLFRFSFSWKIVKNQCENDIIFIKIVLIINLKNINFICWENKIFVETDIYFSCCIWIWIRKICTTISILIRLITHINIIPSEAWTITWITTNCIFWLNERIFWWWNVVRIFECKNKRLFGRILNIFIWRIPLKRSISIKMIFIFFDVIMLIVVIWLETLNKCFHF